ncbi:MAG TPA: Ig-like domain-containing protein [Kofleriaceae bacterium]|nr:Ig-like domain-containing protein [Kofleriaceae bacterium]
MVLQVRLKETYTAGSSTGLERVVFGFGSLPDASPDDEHPVTTASANGNKLRIIVDELLRGNNLEEVQCRFKVAADEFARVPLGATPDDVARCSVAQDVLTSRCPGRNPLSLCICAIDNGCPSGNKIDGTPNVTPRGESVGVLDANFDGAADVFRFIPGAVGIRCGTNDVSIDLAASYWTPSGDQQRPAQGGFDALGPAIVLVPGPIADNVALPTGGDCGLVVSPDVVDKDGNQVCAPPDGEIAAGCTPGDVSAVKFTVEPMSFALNSALSVTAQPRTADIRIKANVPIDPVSLGPVMLSNVTVTEDPATNYTAFTAVLSMPGEITIHWTAVGGLAPLTHYVITVPTTVTDRYQRSAPQPFQLSFTTAN